MEARQLLSTVGPSTTITPNLQVLAASPNTSPSEISAAVTNPTPYSSALTPALIDVAYNINRAWTSGKGQTVAIVDAYNDPNIASDLATFDNTYKLPTASLTVENQYGQTSNLPATDPNWSMEIALDVEWAHVAAPGARIILIEANSASTNDLMTAVQTAARQASVVSMSWGGSEFSSENQFDSSAFFGNPRVTFVAASGDDGAASGAEWPAVSPNVVSVGGTSLTLNPSWAIANQPAWSASGSFWSGFSGSAGGTSLYEPEPSYQTSTVGNTGTRATPDVASVGDPNTGLSVYDSVPGAGQTGWFQIGGTSAGAPLWAGIIADADQARAAVGKAPLSSAQTLNLLYGLYKSGSYYSDFYDVINGQNFAGGAGWGYDLVTGLGSPYATRIVAASAAYTVTSTNLKLSAAKAVTRTGAKVTAHVATPPGSPALSSATAINVAAATISQGAAVVAATPTTSLPLAAAQTVSHQSAAIVAIGSPRVAQSTVSTVHHFAGPSSEGAVWAVAPGIPVAANSEAIPLSVQSSTAPGIATSSPLALWDLAVEDHVGLPADLEANERPLLPPTAEEPAEATTVPNTLFLISGAVGLWGTWMYGSRHRVDERRRMRVLDVVPGAR